MSIADSTISSYRKKQTKEEEEKKTGQPQKQKAGRNKQPQVLPEDLQWLSCAQRVEYPLLFTIVGQVFHKRKRKRKGKGKKEN